MPRRHNTMETQCSRVGLTVLSCKAQCSSCKAQKHRIHLRMPGAEAVAAAACRLPKHDQALAAVLVPLDHLLHVELQ